jgi:putative nucleotidyltransferase with HDIG domain
MPSTVSRDAAWTLLTQWVESPSLRRHCMSVEASMRAYAERNGEDVELWGATGLLHDMDYEKHPDMTKDDGHPRTALRVLEEEGWPPELIRAVASHADFMGVPRETSMEKTLYAVDELSGFVVACAAVRPDGIHGMAPKSVKKKLKTPAFAAAVNRDEVREGAEQLGVEFDEHLRIVIAALEARADELELNGSAGASSAA